jgi:hypothetical protein
MNSEIYLSGDFGVGRKAFLFFCFTYSDSKK